MSLEKKKSLSWKNVVEIYTLDLLWEEEVESKTDLYVCVLIRLSIHGGGPRDRGFMECIYSKDGFERERERQINLRKKRWMAIMRDMYVPYVYRLLLGNI